MTVTASGIWTPDAGDDYALTTDLAAMAASIETATNSIVDNAISKNASSAVNHAALPMLNNSPGDVRVTVDTRIIWTWDGTRWTPTAGKLPWCHVFTTGVTNLGTTYSAIDFGAGSSSGAHGGTTFTVPAGCSGLYQISFGGRVAPNAANVFVAVFVNGAEQGGTSAVSGGQDYLSNTVVLNLTAGHTVQMRGRVFTGSGTIAAGANWDVSFLHAT